MLLFLRAERKPPSPRTVDRIIRASFESFLDAPGDQDKAFLVRQLVQTMMPHTDPGDVQVWSRSNGNVTLTIQQSYRASGEGVGHPYGTIPRLLMVSRS